MQYADGGDLQSYLKNNFNHLTWNDKKKLAYQIADGLNYLHNENILHRDLVSIILFLFYFISLSQALMIYFNLAFKKYSYSRKQCQNHRFWYFKR